MGQGTRARTGSREAIAGVIANPASGRDIRRLVAHASVFGNDEKVNILRRAIMGMVELGVRRVLYMPDPSRLVTRAVEEIETEAEIVAVDGPLRAEAGDTVSAAAAMEAAGARVIVSLGGDGTNRALAKGTSAVPVVPISTGTNNVFPVMVEGTLAGLAAGALAVGAVDPAEVAPRCKRIELRQDRALREIALVDAAVLEPGFVGSRAIWAADGLRELFLTRAEPHAIGMSAVGGLLAHVTPEDDCGLHVVVGKGGAAVRAPIAPGLIEAVGVARTQRLELGQAVPVRGRALLALDGERELVLGHDEELTLGIARTGPPVVDIPRCLAAARDAGLLRVERPSVKPR